MLPTMHWGRDRHPHLAQVSQGGDVIGSLQQPTQVDPTNHSSSFGKSWKFSLYLLHSPSCHARLAIETGRWGGIAWPVPALESWVIEQRGDLTPLDVVASASLIPCEAALLVEEKNDKDQRRWSGHGGRGQGTLGPCCASPNCRITHGLHEGARRMDRRL